MSDLSNEKKLAKAEAEAAKARAKALRPWFQKKRFIVPLGLVVLIALSSALNSGQSDSPGVETTISPTVPGEEAVTPEPTNSETIGQQNAREQAESYLDGQSFSREGLIDQLEYEGYSNEDSVYAVDILNVDWNQQAALKAESYLDGQSFSRQGLLDQLEYEGFTKKQAEFGVAAVGY
jgi:hypothetical protein